MSISVPAVVIQVIADAKGLNSADISLADLLSALGFDTAVERRALAPQINVFFQDVMGMQFDTLMHPSETGEDQTVGAVVQKVVAKHPRSRAGARAEMS